MDDDWTLALGALAAVGIGALAYAAMNGEPRRQTFQEALRLALGKWGIGWVGAKLARARGLPVWLVTVNHPMAGIATHRVPFGQGVDPYNQQTLDQLIGKLLTMMPGAERAGL